MIDSISEVKLKIIRPYSRRVTYAIILFSSLFYSCNSNDNIASTDSINSGIVITHSKETGTVAKQTAAIVIEGMSCEMACVSAVNKTMKGLEGTSNIDMHFDASLTLDTCYVDFNAEKITPNDMIQAIQETNGGLYKVKSVEIITVAPSSGCKSAPTNHPNTSDDFEKSKNSKFNFPSVLDIIKRVNL